MLTVDQIRREMEKIGELPGRQKTPGERMEQADMRKEKVARVIPDAVDRRWIYKARKSELKKVLGERYNVAEDMLGGDLNSLRKIAGDKIAGKRRKRAAAPERPPRIGDFPSSPKVRGAPKRKRAAAPERPPRIGDFPSSPKVRGAPKMEESGKPRLVLAETFPCPSCGAQLMIERGGEG